MKIHKTEMGETVYISGPMSGLPKGKVRRTFRQAEFLLSLAGFRPVNPDKNPVGRFGDWGMCMRSDLAMLDACDAVAMLPGWEHSKGATIEKLYAEVCGKTILYL